MQLIKPLCCPSLILALSWRDNGCRHWLRHGDVNDPNSDVGIYSIHGYTDDPRCSMCGIVSYQYFLNHDPNVYPTPKHVRMIILIRCNFNNNHKSWYPHSSANSVCHGSHLNSNLTHERGTMTPGPAQGHEISTRHRGTRVFFPAKDIKLYCNRFRQQRCFVPGEWCKNLKGQEKRIIFRIMTQKKKQHNFPWKSKIQPWVPIHLAK